MEYNLLKQIEPNLGFLPYAGFSLSSTPAKDFVNPGVGQLSREFNLFVPLSFETKTHMIQKVGEIINEDDQAGEGEDSNDNDVMQQDDISVSATNNDENPMEFNEKKRKNLDPGVYESFMNPKKIKIGKLILPQRPKSEKTKKKQS
jgi:hypothetical protein